jgi:hypothetical protein
VGRGVVEQLQQTVLRWSRRGGARFFAPIWLTVLLLASLSWLVGCGTQPPAFAGNPAAQITITADGETRTLTTEAANVREALAEADVTVGETDEVSPPLFTPLADGLEVAVVRVTESIVLIERSVPFSRRVVRNENMSADDPPLIIQGGQTGLEELTVRIVYRDGLESERRTTQVTVVEQARDEIVMVGIGALTDNITFRGLVAFISGDSAVLLRGQSAFPETLSTGEGLDGRVFRLSPTGSHLLFTRVTTDTEKFNSLYVLPTARDSEPRALGIDNVLWADWNPSRLELPQIAYTTAEATALPPGWEANNDLWIGDVPLNPELPFEPEQLIEAYPATYGWWGGTLAWAPDGRRLAYAFADEVGVIEVDVEEGASERLQLQRFVEFNTRGDWVWVPSLSWASDARTFAFTNHAGEDDAAGVFDTWAANVPAAITVRFADQTGMWSHPHWSPGDPGHIAYLRATEPLQSERSSYTLWLMDADGSNARQIYPPPGETSRFPADEQFMAWGSSGEEMVFVFADALYWYDLTTAQATRLMQDDSLASHPTWAPYGQAIGTTPATGPVAPIPTPGSRPTPPPQ